LKSKDTTLGSYTKLKYVSQRSSTKNYLDDYEDGVVSDKILLEVVLQLDPFKTVSVRTTTDFLSFLGSIGGFNNALRLIFSSFGAYFSSKFFLASISGSLYL